MTTTLTVEQIAARRALAGLCRGAIRGCDERTDPSGRIEALLTSFLALAGFE